MPRENRKRGKKHKKKPEEQYGTQQDQGVEPLPEPQAGPSWIVSASSTSITTPTQEAPFGYVDAEIKAYFRTVDTQIRDWQEEGFQRADAGEDEDPNEDRRLFFVAALSEMSGKEKELATDPDCSSILERMTYSMDDFVRRVFMDRLSGSFQQLVKHRFASHVCQTLFSVAAETVARESRGIFPPVPESSEKGELRALTQLIIDACEELTPNLPSSIMDPFASHVVRALLGLLCPHLFPADQQNKSSHVRSKKSAAYKAKQGAMKSVFTPDNPLSGPSRQTPPEFNETARSFVTLLKEKLDENEVRALAANQVASPVLQMLLEVEADQQMHNIPGSLMDRVLAGLITALHDDPAAVPEPSDYVGTLLRDPTSSHLLETLVSRSTESVFDVIWTSYFKGKLPRLGVHPVANFVVAKTIERANESQLIDTCQELEPVLPKIVKSARTGVLRAMINRSAALHKQEDSIIQIVFKAFDMTSVEDRTFVVPCVLRLLTLKDYRDAVSHAEAAKAPAETPKGDGHPRRKKGSPSDPLEPKTQGAVLLQSMLRLPAPHNQPVLDSIQSLPIDDLLAMAYHVAASRVLDAIFDSPSVPIKTKRNFVLSFIGHFHILVDDRIGSRVGDRCWAFADPYLREKIARSVIPHEHTLAGSFYGKFFARNLNLHLLKRNPEEWKSVQADSKFASSTSQTATTTTAPIANVKSPANTKPQMDPSVPKSSLKGEEQHDLSKEPRKRKTRHEDEIDEVFGKAIGKKVKRAGLGDGESKSKGAKPEEVPQKKHKKDRDVEMKDETLADVLGAIRTAPKDGGDRKKKKRTKH